MDKMNAKQRLNKQAKELAELLEDSRHMDLLGKNIRMAHWRLQIEKVIKSAEAQARKEALRDAVGAIQHEIDNNHFRGLIVVGMREGKKAIEKLMEDET